MTANYRYLKILSMVLLELVILWSFLYVLHDQVSRESQPYMESLQGQENLMLDENGQIDGITYELATNTGDEEVVDDTVALSDTASLVGQYMELAPSSQDYLEPYREVSSVERAENAVKARLRQAIETEANHHKSIYDKNPSYYKPDLYSDSILGRTLPAEQSYMDEIIYVCDSPTYWILPYGLLSQGSGSKQVWTGPNGTMTITYHEGYELYDPNDGQRKLLIDMVEEHQPSMMITALGINGMSFMTEEEFVTVYSKLVENVLSVSQDTQMILMSIYPITPAYKYWGSIDNVKITRYNQLIVEVANEYDVYYLNTFDLFFDDNGELDWTLYRDDGLHPNKEGLSRVLEYIRNHKIW